MSEKVRISMVNYLESFFHTLNTSSYFAGIMMILLNIGGKYFVQEFGTTIDFIFNLKIVRRLLLFTVFFVATRNVKTSLILTAVFVILALELFNEKSNMCVIPKNMLEFIDKNKDGVITGEEVQQSLKLLQKAGYVKK
jgi:hypothetical protein